MRRKRRGQALIEFAIVIPVILLLAAGCMEFGSLYHQKVLLDHAAREGARMAAIGFPPAQIDQIVTTMLLPRWSSEEVSLLLSEESPFGYDMVRYSVSTNLKPLTPVCHLAGIPADGIPVTSDAVFRVE